MKNFMLGLLAFAVGHVAAQDERIWERPWEYSKEEVQLFIERQTSGELSMVGRDYQQVFNCNDGKTLNYTFSELKFYICGIKKFQDVGSVLLMDPKLLFFINKEDSSDAMVLLGVYRNYLIELSDAGFSVEVARKEMVEELLLFHSM